MVEIRHREHRIHVRAIASFKGPSQLVLARLAEAGSRHLVREHRQRWGVDLHRRQTLAAPRESDVHGGGILDPRGPRAHCRAIHKQTLGYFMQRPSGGRLPLHHAVRARQQVLTVGCPATPQGSVPWCCCG